MNELTVSEKTRYNQLNQVVAAGMAEFVAVGSALREIRDGRLYRDEYANFKDYCLNKWELTGSRAYQLIAAVEVVEEVKSQQIVDTNTPAPKRESQARALAQAPKGERAKAWNTAVVANEGKQPTAVQVEQAVTSTILTTIPEKFHTHLLPLPESERAAVWQWAKKLWPRGDVSLARLIQEVERRKPKQVDPLRNNEENPPAAATIPPSLTLSPSTAVSISAVSPQLSRPAVCDTCLTPLVPLVTSDGRLIIECPTCEGTYCTDCQN